MTLECHYFRYHRRHILRTANFSTSISSILWPQQNTQTTIQLPARALGNCSLKFRQVFAIHFNLYRIYAKKYVFIWKFNKFMEIIAGCLVCTLFEPKLLIVVLV